MITTAYRSLSINERINLRSGFCVSLDDETKGRTNLQVSSNIQSSIVAKRISQKEYDLHRRIYYSRYRFTNPFTN